MPAGGSRPLRAYGFASLGLLLSVSVLVHLARGGRPETAGIAVVFWAGSIVAGTFAVRALEPRPAAPARGAVALRPLVWLVLAVAFAVRVVRLGEVPWVLDGDAAWYALQALSLFRDGIANPFGYGGNSQPVPSIALGGLAMLVSGPTIAALRFPWAVIGTAAVGASWLLFRRILGPRLGLAASALLATWHFHVHYSRVGLNNVADTLVLTLVLLGFVRALRSASARDWFLAGSAAGAGLLGYTGAWMAPPLLFGLTFAVAARAPRAFFSRHGIRPLAAVAGFLLVAAPMVQTAVQRPADFHARQRAVGLLGTGRLEDTASARGMSVAALLFDQVRQAGLAFNTTTDTSTFYGLPSPLLDRTAGVLFLLGLLHATVRSIARRGSDRLFPLVAWWWSGMILGGALTVSPPASQRLVGISVPTAGFVVWGAALLLGSARRLFRLRPAVPLALGVAAFAAVSLRTYAGFSSRRVSGGRDSELATAVALRVAPFGVDHVVHFAGAPRLFASIPPMEFLLPDALLLDVVAPLHAPPPAECIPEGLGAVFVFTPERRAELTWVRCTFPDGTLQDLRRPVDDVLVGTLFVVSPRQAAAARTREAGP